ncbi:HalOD1 output domain-containing protein [Halorussus ruber]|uniref:HalOD1 output domain-containing protein n=1 Tax=Halorussus ruber TaxID=1126238 RepID=UPI001FEAC91E|nr:HalOD1 output domain-containing protein [Halorussus ruber]
MSGMNDPTVLPPLYEVVDTDALNALFERAWDSGESDVSVTFRYAGCVVTVEGMGRVVVRKTA